MENTKDILSSITTCSGPPILMGDDSPIEVTGKGRVEPDHGSFQNVLHIPQLSENLLSVYQITHSSSCKKVEFTPDFVSIFNKQNNSKVVVGEVNHKSRLYTFTKFIELDSSVLLTNVDDSSRLWHERFGHLNFRYMQQLSKKGMVIGLPDIHFFEGVCEGCVIGKHPQEKFKKEKAHRASSPLDLIHSDLMRPLPHPSIGKARYVLTFLDDYSHYTCVFFLRQKSEVFEHLKEFKALVETQSGKERSKPSIQIMGGSMSTEMLRIFVLRLGYSCSTQYPTLCNRTGLLRGRKNLSRRWPLACCMQGHLLKSFGLVMAQVVGSEKPDPTTKTGAKMIRIL
jgi:hypothetical protein